MCRTCDRLREHKNSVPSELWRKKEQLLRHEHKRKDGIIIYFGKVLMVESWCVIFK
jgi:hypothetical protein